MTSGDGLPDADPNVGAWSFELDVLVEFDDEHGAEFLSAHSDTDVAVLLAHLPAERAAGLLVRLDQERAPAVLGLLPAPKRDRVRELLGYNPDTAAGLMRAGFISVGEGATVGEAIAAVRAAAPAREVHYVYVSAATGHLLGAVSLADLIRAEEEVSLRSLVAGETLVAATDAELPGLARLMSEHDRLSLPVTDASGRMIGELALGDVAKRMFTDGRRWQQTRLPE